MSRPGRLRNAVLLGGGTLGAAVFGLIFQSLLAYHFGAGAETDAWFMSLSIYAFLGKFLMLTHLKSIALPVYRRLGEHDPDQARRFGALLLRWSGGALVAASILLVFAAPLLVDTLAPGYDGAIRALTVDLVRIRVPALVFLGTTTAGLVVLESAHRFGVTVSAQKIVPAAVSLLLLLLLTDRFGMVGVGWMGLAGGVAGGLVALVAVGPRLAGRSRRGAADAELRGVAGQWLKFSGSNAATFVGEWAFRVGASLLPVGLFSAVLYGRMVQDLLHGAVNDTAQSVSLPRFAEAAGREGASAEEALARVGSELRESLASLSALTLPLAAFVAATAPWIVALLFGRGRFLEDGMVGPSTLALRIFAAGFFLQGLNQLVFAGAFAAGWSHVVNRVQIVGHLARAVVLVPAVLAFSYVGLVAAQVAMNLLVLALLLVMSPAAWRLAKAGRRALLSGSARGVALATAVPAGLFWAVSAELPDPVAAGTWGRLAVLACVSAGWTVLYVMLASVLGVPAVRSGLGRLGRLGRQGVGMVVLVAGAWAWTAAPGQAQQVGPGLLPVDHWSRAVLDALGARGGVAVGRTGQGPLDAGVLDRLLASRPDDPLASAALDRLREEMGVRPDGVPVSARLGTGYRHLRAGTAGASGALATASIRVGGADARVFAGAEVEAATGGAFVLRTGGVGVRLGPMALQVGRNRVQLGGGLGGALVLSPEVALDGALLTTTAPWTVPLFGRVFLTAGAFSMGDYEGVVDDPWFGLLRVAAQPAPWLLVGASRAVLLGGDFRGGTPPFQTVPHPPDPRPMGAGDVLDILVGRVTEYDNQVWGFDVRGSLAGVGVPAVVYGEIALEDNERSFGDGAVLAGALVDVAAGRSLVSVRYEYAGVGGPGRWCAWCDTLPAFWYQHTRFQDGWRVGDDLLGHPLGGYGLHHTLSVAASDRELRFRGRLDGVRLRRDEWNLLEPARPGWAWGLRASLRFRATRSLEVSADADLEWGDEGWRAGSSEVALALLFGAPRARPR